MHAVLLDLSQTSTRLATDPKAVEPLDIGRLAEALLYYDRVYVICGSSIDWSQVISWFSRSGAIQSLLQMAHDGTLIPCHHQFVAGAFTEGDVQGGMVFISNTSSSDLGFRAWACYPAARRSLGMGRTAKEVVNALCSQAIEYSAPQFEPSIREAERTFFTPRRASLFMDTWLSTVYRMQGRHRAPTVERATITPTPLKNGGNGHRVEFVLQPDSAAELSSYGITLPGAEYLLGDISHTNISIETAKRLGSDIWPAELCATFHAEKLLEASLVSNRSESDVSILKYEADFPDVRLLVNEGRLTAADIVAIRPSCARFRKWLGERGPRDASAIVAYHEEAASLLGLSNGAKRLLRMVGLTVAGTALGFVAAKYSHDPSTSLVTGAAVGPVSEYLLGLSNGFKTGWSPAVFNAELSSRIRDALSARDGVSTDGSSRILDSD